LGTRRLRRSLRSFSSRTDKGVGSLIRKGHSRGSIMINKTSLCDRSQLLA
jgi:hypothetical protein